MQVKSSCDLPDFAEWHDLTMFGHKLYAFDLVVIDCHHLVTWDVYGRLRSIWSLTMNVHDRHPGRSQPLSVPVRIKKTYACSPT